jgi:hypothetical protein
MAKRRPARPDPKKGPRKPLPTELAKDAIAHEEKVPGDRVRLTFVLPRALAEALAAEAIRRETNLVTLVQEILEVAAAKVRR